jgi:hypothetical protein
MISLAACPRSIGGSLDGVPPRPHLAVDKIYHSVYKITQSNASSIATGVLAGNSERKPPIVQMDQPPYDGSGRLAPLPNFDSLFSSVNADYRPIRIYTRNMMMFLLSLIADYSRILTNDLHEAGVH